MFSKTCKAIALSCLVMSSSAWAYCEIDESTGTVTDNGQCTSWPMHYGEARYSGAEKVQIKLPAEGSGIAIKPVVCTFTANTGDTQTPIDGSNLFPNPGTLTLQSAGQTYHEGPIPGFPLFPVAVGTQVTITPSVKNEETTPEFHHVNFDNPHCPAGSGCVWDMECHAE